MIRLSLISRNKGQITLDAILAVMFLLLVSAFIFYNVSNTVSHLKDAEIVDRVYVIADVFENYALLSYSKNVNITTELKPIGLKNYTIYFGDKKIVVDTTKTIVFIPTSGGVRVEGDVEPSGQNLSNIINITYGNNEFYVLKNISIEIQ
ncbi:hypothetical protein [Methanotorris igneus]|uniref:hypothetical protein n=1 Tax=Methanotorris igneus TaxID=2189 RepID=UPI00373AE5F7